MLTVKFMKYGPKHEEQPTFTEGVMVRECDSIHVKIEARRSVVQLGDAPGDTFTTTVGAEDAVYSRAYVMNEAGRTVETIT
jgi:hypothetical protein